MRIGSRVSGRRVLLGLTVGLGWGLLQVPPAGSAPPPPSDPVPLEVFFDLAAERPEPATRALSVLERRWQSSYTVMLVELLAAVNSGTTRDGILELLATKTGQGFGHDRHGWYRWVWQADPGVHPDYAEFKGRLYAEIDPRFERYFDHRPASAIRLDEIRWGGVKRDGIPPLDHPQMIAAPAAAYLDDSNVVFGIEHHGDARAYPQRIMGWHELVRDRLGGEELTGVYCTLCGSMVFYRSAISGVQHILGTSGFLYRSNKLMYDHATESLWSTLTGEPVVGPLVGKGLRLEPLSVVTTTWGAWRRRHPATQVLSPATGFRRDYREGAAYREYFSTDELMFPVPKPDRRLANKAEVLALRSAQTPGESLAIAAELLRRQPVFHDRLGTVDFVILTDSSGANRVYESRGRRFVSFDGNSTATDSEGIAWTLSETALTNAAGAGLRRLPAHRAFWFGWHAAYPDTRLVQ